MITKLDIPSSGITVDIMEWLQKTCPTRYDIKSDKNKISFYLIEDALLFKLTW